MIENDIKIILEKSNFENPVIIKTKYGFTKFWKDKKIKFFSWGKNWVDRKYSSLDLDSAAEFILKSRLGVDM